MAEFETALADAQQWVGTVLGVVMVGEGKAEDGTPTIDVWVTRPVSLPTAIRGVPVRVVEGGVIEAQ